MNTRQFELYDLLKKGERSRDDICIRLDSYYHRIEEISEGIRDENSAAYRLLRSDIQTINKSDAQHRIVPVKRKGRLIGYKLADRSDELNALADRYHAEAMRKLEMEKAIRTAMRNDGQLRIAREDVKEIRAYGRETDVR